MVGKTEITRVAPEVVQRPVVKRSNFRQSDDKRQQKRRDGRQKSEKDSDGKNVDFLA